MQIPKLLSAVCAAAILAGSFAVRAQDTPVQAAARAALMQKLAELDAQGNQPTNLTPPVMVVTPSGAAQKPASQPAALETTPTPTAEMIQRSMMPLPAEQTRPPSAQPAAADEAAAKAQAKAKAKADQAAAEAKAKADAKQAAAELKAKKEADRKAAQEQAAEEAAAKAQAKTKAKADAQQAAAELKSKQQAEAAAETPARAQATKPTESEHTGQPKSASPVPSSDNSEFFTPVPPPSNPEVPAGLQSALQQKANVPEMTQQPEPVVVPSRMTTSPPRMATLPPRLLTSPPAQPAAPQVTPAVKPLPAMAATPSGAEQHQAGRRTNAVPIPPAKPAAPVVAPVVKPPPPANVPYAGQGLGFKPMEVPPPPVSAQKQSQLQALLAKYMADQISPEEYHKERAAILAEP